MVSKIVSGKSIMGMLHYNEDKVVMHEAKLLLASGFATEVNGMNVAQKLKRFDHRTMLNGKVKTNAIHISLNFDAGDKLSTGQLQQIAVSYMEKIGFGDQPYLVYQHTDVSHPHLHICTTNIRADGERIDIHNIGKTLSETARKILEKEFKLVQAEGRTSSNTLGIKAANLEKARYGKTPTKRTITNVVNAVVQTYKFTSLAELNAVLKQFNVTADRGAEHTDMFQKKGLIYSIVNENGEPVGIPIKASAIYNQPTLKNLEKKFEQNTEKRKPYKQDLKCRIDMVFAKYSHLTKATLVTELEKQKVNVLFRTNDQGLIYGVTFVDHNSKTVFNGSDLGKAYSAKALTERLSNMDKLIKVEPKIYLKEARQTSYLNKEQPNTTYLRPSEQTNLLEMVLGKAGNDPNTGMRKKKKRRKGKWQEQEQGQSL